MKSNQTDVTSGLISRLTKPVCFILSIGCASAQRFKRAYDLRRFEGNSLERRMMRHMAAETERIKAHAPP